MPKALLFTAAVVSTALAGWFTIKSGQAGSEEGRLMHQALALTALNVMEDMEYQATQMESQVVHAAYDSARSESHQYAYQAAIDNVYASRTETIAEYMAKIAAEEQEGANDMWSTMDETDAARLELLNRLDEERQAKENLLQKLRDNQFGDGVCGWKGIRSLCTLVGGSASLLQSQADSLSTQIHRDMQARAAVDHREFMERLVANALQDKETMYQESAKALFDAATLWQIQADKDRQEAILLNRTAFDLKLDGIVLKLRLAGYASSMKRLSATTTELLDQAKEAQMKSQRFSMAALILAATASVFFLYEAVPRLVLCVQELGVWSRDEKRFDKEIRHAAFYSLLHIMIFLVTAGWCRDDVYNLDQYSVEKRAVVIAYFAFLASILQSLFLHAIPHIHAEHVWTTLSSPNVKSLALICKYFCLRALCLLPLFAMELLFAWLSPLRTWALDPGFRQYFLTDIFLVVLLTLYYVYFEPCAEQYCSASGQSTVCMVQNSSDDQSTSHSLMATERSPLKETKSPTATEIVPYLFLTGIVTDEEMETSSHYSLHSESPHYVSIQEELSKLILPFEMLATFCLMLIVYVGLKNLLGNAALIYAAILLSVSAACASALITCATTSPCAERSVSTVDYSDGPPKILYV
jgi:hypothetical protein